MQFVKLNGINIHYQIIGAPDDKPVLVFSNSLGTDFRIWRDLVMRFAGDYAIIAYDKRGHGLSDAPPAPYKMDDHVGDLAALLDYLSVKEAIVCGLSVGGLIAQGLALTRPDLVRALILCDTGHKIGNDELWNMRIETVQAQGLSALSDAILERWFSEAYRRDDNPDFAGYRNMLERTPVAGYAGTSYAIRDSDFTAMTPTIDVPTLCIVGDEDGATPPALVEELSGLIPKSEFEVITGAGHLPCIEQPIAMYEIMHTFLRRTLANA
ncbi:MAG: 3-oxoadipate enol-lactonase [Pseudomonadota bacterium]